MQIKHSLSIADARRVAEAAAAEARRHGWPVVIAIVDDGANLLYLERHDGCKLGSIDTAIGKARSAVRFAMPTKKLEGIIASGRSVMLNLPDVVPIQGGLPALHEGQVVGGVGVSGVQSAEDEQIAQAGLDAL